MILTLSSTFALALFVPFLLIRLYVYRAAPEV